LFKDARTEKNCDSLEDNDGVYSYCIGLGLGAPHLDQNARGAFFGITGKPLCTISPTQHGEAIADQVLFDVAEAMEKDSGSHRELSSDVVVPLQ